MSIKRGWKKIWNYLKKDTWDSWLVSIVLLFLIIKFVFFPVMSLATGSPLPLVVVESCSMYHGISFDEWWSRNSAWYEQRNISKEDFKEFSSHNGLNKGDIILVVKRAEYKEGDIIIYNPSVQTAHPIIHRIISTPDIETKGDHNSEQISFEKSISNKQILGKSIIRIPLIGWVKLIFYEPFRAESERGLCRV